jgi:ankyrin repeat protein
MDAVLHQREEAVRLLPERGARTTIENHWQQSALTLARADGLDAIARLIQERIASDTRRMDDLVLVAAIKAGDVAAVKRHLAAGVRVEERVPVVGGFDDDYTPCGLAAREGQTEIVRLLLDAGADPRRVSGLMGGTPLHEACYFGHADVVQLLTERTGKDGVPAVEIDAQGAYNGLTALHDAVWHGHAEAARALVEAGARLDLTTHAGWTPRELASLYGYDELARYLADAEER